MTESTDTSMSSTDFQGRTITVYVVGDGHGLNFNALILPDSKRPNERFAFDSKHCSKDHTAANFTDETGSLTGEFLDVLLSEKLLTTNGTPTHLSLFEDGIVPFENHPSSRTEPILLLTYGGNDLQTKVLKQIGDAVDFPLPPYLEGVLAKFEIPAESTQIELNVVLELVKRVVTPYVTGLKTLKNAGFQNLMVLGLPPPKVDRESLRQNSKFSFGASLRYKTTVLFNAVLKHSTDAIGIHFINTWEETTQDGNLNQEYHFDGVHLNKEAANLAARKVIGNLPVKPMALNIHYNQVYQEAMKHIAQSGFDLNKKIRKRFEKNLIIMFPGIMPKETVKKIRENLNFDLDVGNRHNRSDWNGNTVEPFSNMLFTANPSKEVLKTVYEFVYESPMYRNLVSCFNFEFTIPTCRPIKSLPHESQAGPHSWHLDGGPPGTFRIMIYLTDVDKNGGPTAFKHRTTGKEHQAVAPAGTLVVFDANSLLHRGTPPVDKNREVLDIVVYPKIGDSPQFVMNPGMNNWPVDPYFYSINGFSVYPEIEENQIIHTRKQLN